MVTSLALFGVLSGFAYSLGFPVPPWAVAALPVAAALMSLGAWYRVRIGPTDIELRRFRGWLIPHLKRRFALDADVDLYETLDSMRPQGLVLESPVIGESSSGAFGPYFSIGLMQARRDAMHAAIERARDHAPPPPEALRLPSLADAVESLDVAGALRDDRGRLRELRSIAPITLGDVTLPAGSCFVLNRDGFIDPSRDDELRRVRLSEPTELRAGLVAGVDAELVFDEGGRLTVVHRASTEPFRLEGHAIRGDEPIGFGASGRLQTFTLAESEQLGGFGLPPGTKLTQTVAIDSLPYRTTAWLGGPLTLPDAELRSGDALYFDAEDRLVAFSPHRDVVFHGIRIRHGYVPIPTHPDGIIDLEKCRRAGIVAMG